MPLHPLYLAAPVAVGLAAAWLWPSDGNSAPADAITVETAYRAKDGHFYVDGRINDQKIRFLVDTGASAVALTEDDAKKAGIDVSSKRYEVIGQGASGIVRGIRFEIDKLELGEIAEQDIEAAVVEGANMSLLGAPFLRKIDEIVIRGDTIEFRDAPKG